MLRWGELSPCREDTPHATSRTYLDAAFKGVRLLSLKRWGWWGILSVELREGNSGAVKGPPALEKEGGETRAVAYPRGTTSSMVQGSQGEHAPRSHLCEGQVEEKEEATVRHSNLKTQQKTGCNMWPSLPLHEQEQTAHFPAVSLSQGAKDPAVLQEILGRRQGWA